MEVLSICKRKSTIYLYPTRHPFNVLFPLREKEALSSKDIINSLLFYMDDLDRTFPFSCKRAREKSEAQRRFFAEMRSGKVSEVRDDEGGGWVYFILLFLFLFQREKKEKKKQKEKEKRTKNYKLIILSTQKAAPVERLFG